MTYGLLGYPLTHSFSRPYFTEKFEQLGLSASHRYLNFQLEEAAGFQDLKKQYPDLHGVNVTIPHKKAVMQYLDELDPAAERIGAVNCIRFDAAGRSKGFNTDYLGFREDFLDHLRRHNWVDQAFGMVQTEDLLETFLESSSALILGTGGASLAVREALEELGLETLFVSRTAGEGRITYEDLNRRPELLTESLIVVNTTPLGMAPKVDGYPDLPYNAFTPAHFVYDLVYNPSETAFLRQAREAGAGTGNGLGMLERQAEAGWAIWNGSGPAVLR